MPEILKFKYQTRPRRDPKTGEVSETFYPMIDALLIYKHQMTRGGVSFLVDSGSEICTLPAEVAEAFFGMRPKQIRKGKMIKIGGVQSGMVLEGFKHTIELQTPYFKFKVPMYIAYEAALPILGRKGFFDKFKSVNFREDDQVLELVPKR